MAKTTASDALRGSGRVSPQTRERVLEVAQRLGYVPNAAARHLRRAATGTIGLYLPEVLTRLDYYMTFVFGAVERAATNGYDVTLITDGHGTARRRHPRVDGLVLCDPLAGDPVVDHLMGAGLPTVTCERLPSGGTADGVVRSEHGAMLGELLDHLYAAGARRPAFVVSNEDSDWSATLHDAYRHWCDRHGVEPVARTVPFGSPPERVPATVRTLLVEHPYVDALICGPDGAAAAALPVIQRAGRRVGADLLLASCVDSPAMRSADPPITAIDLRPREAGASCADVLFELISGASFSGTEHIHPVHLAARASTRGQ